MDKKFFCQWLKGFENGLSISQSVHAIFIPLVVLILLIYVNVQGKVLFMWERTYGMKVNFM